MIDIHSHVIYDCDDGSRNIEQSIRMLKAASSVGVSAVCFTPHYMEDGYKNDRAVLEKKVEKIRECISEENIDIELFLGEEVFIFPSLTDNLDKIICLNDSRYILFEIPLVEEISYIDDVVYKLFSYGKVPILAHPERYFSSAKDFSFIENLAEKGVLLQININSLIGHYGKEANRIAVKLLKNNMVQFVGSDAHSSASYYELNESMIAMKKIIGDERFVEITENNPRMVLNNQDIDVRYYKNDSGQKKKLFSLFGKRVK